MKRARSKVVIQNKDLEMCLRAALEKGGYSLSHERRYGETGVDIVAQKGDELIHIEVIGYKATGPARSRDFYECFFRTVSRLNDGAKQCVMAMHKQAGVGLPARARHYGEAWRRIGMAFPELNIWLIDPEKQSYNAVLGGSMLLP